MNNSASRSIANIVDCDLKKDKQILIIFGAYFFYTAGHQMTAVIPTSYYVCFCTIWEK